MKTISVRKIITDFNSSNAGRTMIPMGLAAGWPAISRVGRIPAITIPYFSRKRQDGRVALFPIFCSVTLALNNPERILDFTIYSVQKSWQDVDFSKPCGYFKHAALADVTSPQQYRLLQDELFSYYDEMVNAPMSGKTFENRQKMEKLFTKLMEPGLYPQYLRINRKFYRSFCKLEEKAK